MPLTRDFRETYYKRLQRDGAFRRALLREAMDSLLGGDVELGIATLRDYIHGTIGFIELGRELGKTSKGLMRMFGPAGNPQARNLFEVLLFLQQVEGIELQVRVSKSAD
jgi:DNA-binding phage protein